MATKHYCDICGEPINSLRPNSYPFDGKRIYVCDECTYCLDDLEDPKTRDNALQFLQDKMQQKEISPQGLSFIRQYPETDSIEIPSIYEASTRAQKIAEAEIRTANEKTTEEKIKPEKDTTTRKAADRKNKQEANTTPKKTTGEKSQMKASNAAAKAKPETQAEPEQTNSDGGHYSNPVSSTIVGAFAVLCLLNGILFGVLTLFSLPKANMVFVYVALGSILSSAFLFIITNMSMDIHRMDYHIAKITAENREFQKEILQILKEKR